MLGVAVVVLYTGTLLVGVFVPQHRTGPTTPGDDFLYGLAILAWPVWLLGRVARTVGRQDDLSRMARASR